MLFNSYIFVLLFLPLTIIGYFTLNHFHCFRLASVFLLGMSLWFYGYFNLNYLPIILVSVLANYGIYKLLIPEYKPAVRRSILAAAVLFDVGILFYFKYYDFFFENINALFHTDFVLKNLLLPLGISFFTFQQLSFVIDSYRREVPKYSFLHYALFVTYFPQLIAGPIVLHNELVPQLIDEKKRNLNWDNLASGLYLFAFGLAKKVLIADTFGNAANWGFSNIDALNTVSALVVMLSYTIQIYFDFSGYCDMAIGIGKMMNIDLPVNFNSPYKALTIVEFWDRWHMTLTRFFTRYLYIPLGGSRKGTVRTYVNTMVVFLVSGLWHGANWTFVLWGAMHGIFVVVTKHFKQFFARMHPALSWLITFGFVNIAWLFFRADSIRDALRIGKRIVQMNFGSIDTNIVSCFTLPEVNVLFNNILRFNPLQYHSYVYLVLFFLVAFVLLLGVRNAKEQMDTFQPTVVRSLSTVLLSGWCIFSFSGVSTFLYFNF